MTLGWVPPWSSVECFWSKMLTDDLFPILDLTGVQEGIAGSRVWRVIATVVWLFGAMGGAAEAQQRIGHVDTEYILDQMPEYSAVQQKLDRLEKGWREEIQRERQRAERLEQEFAARKVLYTEEERERKRRQIESARDKVERLRQEYFGPDGELYARQKELMRPLQERILKATDRVATSAGYDYVLDKQGAVVFLFAREEHNLSDRVLKELGIDVEDVGGEE